MGIKSLALTVGLAVGLPAFCQTTINSVRVYTEPEDLNFTVDGQQFLSAGEYLWPNASKHVVSSSSALKVNGILTSRYEYQGWVTNLSPTAPPSNAQPITASPDLKWIKLVFKTFHGIYITLPPCTQPIQGQIEVWQGIPPSTRIAAFNCDPQTLSLEASTPITFRAYPNTGYVFRGWGVNSGFSGDAFEISFTLDEPRMFTPQFMPTAATQVDASISTLPAGLEIVADRTAYTGAVQLEWEWGSVHAIGVAEVQMYNNQAYVFQSWNDGGSINHDYTVPPGTRRVDLTATFVRGAIVAFKTSPQGLKLSIDGKGQSWPASNYAWLPGSKHTISAPATQTDSSGRKYQFVSWSGGQPATFDYVAGAGGSSDVLTANYQVVGQLTVASEPAGVSARVNGQTCVTPCAVEEPVGTTVQLSAPGVVELGAGSRLLFDSWRDAAAPTRSVTVTADPTTYTVRFRKQFQLSLNCNPAGGALLQLTPSSSDGYYDEAATVSVSAKANLGFRLLGWTGDLAGTPAVAGVVMDSAKSAILQLQSVPAIAASGVWNSATDAPLRAVAAGSLISIFGAHLAPEASTGTGNPLPQTLDGLTVRVNDSFLPLLFVSPDQINAQLTSNLDPGRHTMIVRIEGMAELSIEFDVARNAPGLFTKAGSDGPIGLFAHPNGELITADNPASPGEMITVFGTGFGAYRVAPPDGFVAAESDLYALSDDAHVVADGSSLTPVFAGRTNLGVGVDGIRFNAPSGPGSSGSISIKVTVNGVDSNTVSLPIRSASR